MLFIGKYIYYFRRNVLVCVSVPIDYYDMLRKFGILQVINEKRDQTNQRRFDFKER